MEWVALAIWLVVLTCALPVTLAAGFGAPSLGVHALLAGAGFALCVVYVAIGGGRWLAWASFGLALAGAAALGSGAARLIADDPSTGPGARSGDETAAPLAGFELPVLLTAAFAMGLAAAGVTLVD